VIGCDEPNQITLPSEPSLALIPFALGNWWTTQMYEYRSDTLTLSEDYTSSIDTVFEYEGDDWFGYADSYDSEGFGDFYRISTQGLVSRFIPEGDEYLIQGYPTVTSETWYNEINDETTTTI